MSNILYLKNEVTGDIKTVEKGFNISVFLFGWIYLIIKGDIFNSLILCASSTGILMLIVKMNNSSIIPYALLISILLNAFVAWNWHKEYIKILSKKDYHEIDPRANS